MTLPPSACFGVCEVSCASVKLLNWIYRHGKCTCPQRGQAVLPSPPPAGRPRAGPCPPPSPSLPGAVEGALDCLPCSAVVHFTPVFSRLQNRPGTMYLCISPFGPHEKVPQSGWLQQQKCLVSQFRRLEAPSRGACRAVPSETSVLGVQTAVLSLCPRMAFCVCPCLNPQFSRGHQSWD